MEGVCACGGVTFRFDIAPMIVHCCHCRSCQRETGSAFVVNALVETSNLDFAGEVETILTPSDSGKGQNIIRCARCKVALWSHYAGSGPKIAFVRVGALAGSSTYPPDVHIFTASKQPWVRLPDGVKSFTQFYPDPAQVWSESARARYSAAKAG